MTNTLKTAAAALIAALAATTAASAQDTDLNQQIAAATSANEAKIFDLVMAKAQANINADLAALNHTAPVADVVFADAETEDDSVVLAGAWF